MVFQPIHDGLEVPGAEVEDPQYAAAYALLTQDPGAALLALRQLAAARPADPLVRLHLQRLESGESGDLIVMSEK